MKQVKHITPIKENTMNISKESILYGVIGLLTGSLITLTLAVYAVNNDHNGMMDAMGMHNNTSSQQMNDTNMPGMDHGGTQ